MQFTLFLDMTISYSKYTALKQAGFYHGIHIAEIEGFLDVQIHAIH